MFALKVKLFILQHEGSHPKYIGPCNCQEEEPYTDFRLRLESVGCIEWPFEFWDLEESYRINIKLEGLNTIRKSIYVIHVSSIEEGGAIKRRRIEACGTLGENEDLLNTMEELENPARDSNSGKQNLSTDSSRVSRDGELGSANDFEVNLTAEEGIQKISLCCLKVEEGIGPYCRKNQCGSQRRTFCVSSTSRIGWPSRNSK